MDTMTFAMPTVYRGIRLEREARLNPNREYRNRGPKTDGAHDLRAPSDIASAPT